MKPTLYPNGFPSAYEELKTFYPVFYRDVFEMDAIWRAAGGGLDEIEDGVDAVVNNNFVSLMDTDALAQMETFLGIPLNQKRTLEARRKLVASYFIGGNHIGAREIKDITRAFTEGTCEVSFVGGTVYIHVKSDIKDTPPEDDYYYILRKKIPAHLGVYTNIEIEFSEQLYVGSNALEGNRYDIVPPPPVGQSAAGELHTGSYITQSDRTGIDLHPQPGLSFETGLHAAAVVLESSKTAVDLPAPERRSAQNALHARTGMVESSRTAADMILYSDREDSAESTVRTGAAYAQTTLVAIAPAFQQERAAAAYTARTGCGVIENTHYSFSSPCLCAGCAKRTAAASPGAARTTERSTLRSGTSWTGRTQNIARSSTSENSTHRLRPRPLCRNCGTLSSASGCCGCARRC